MPMMPTGQAGLASTERAALEEVHGFTGDLRLRTLFDLVAQQLAPGVQRLQVGGEDAGAADVACGQENPRTWFPCRPAGRLRSAAAPGRSRCAPPRASRVEFGAWSSSANQARPLRAAECGSAPAGAGSGCRRAGSARSATMPSATRSRRRSPPAAAPARTAPRPACRPRPRREDGPTNDRTRSSLGLTTAEASAGRRQVVVVGDDHVHARPWANGTLVRGDAGIAGEEESSACQR